MNDAVTELQIRRVPPWPADAEPLTTGQWALPLDGNLALATLQPSTQCAPPLTVVPPPDPEPSPETLHPRASRFVQALVEVASGDRPPTQMARWMLPEVYRELVTRLSVLAHARNAHGPVGAPRSRVVSVHIDRPGPHTAEVAARIVQGHRSRAIALRLEVRGDHRDRHRWMCTALTWG